MSSKEYKLTIRSFHMGEPKEAALKPLEEAAEVFGAWQQAGETRFGDLERVVHLGIVRGELKYKLDVLADELADVIQAACNLAARYDLDMDAAMQRCEDRNIARGRYEGEEI